MPSEVKERVKDFIPTEIADKIATEKEATTIEELKKFLQEKGHPIVERWKAIPAEAVVEREAAEEAVEIPAETPVATLPTLPITAGGFKIILKDAKIYAKKVIIRIEKPEKKG
jgi:acetyl-CoA decarbonylase/synthase complex subunit beta